ncbi:MAG: STAS domain-containing protein [Treponema sp.]|jgi:anti-sigma B factor antagonist|nr:STAS domain-containing protein [Treponema sp.]
MKVEKKDLGSTAVLLIGGKLDSITVSLLERELQLLGDHVMHLILDFSELTYISSAGLRILLQTLKKMNARKGTLKIQNVSKAVRDVFAMSGFLNILVLEEKLVILRKAETETSIEFSLAGKLDGRTLSLLEQALQGLDNKETVILDCELLTALSDNEVRYILNTQKTMAQQHRSLTIKNMSETVQQVFQMVGST